MLCKMVGDVDVVRQVRGSTGEGCCCNDETKCSKTAIVRVTSFWPADSKRVWVAITETNQRVSQLPVTQLLWPKAAGSCPRLSIFSLHLCIQMYPDVSKCTQVYSDVFNVLLCSFAFVIILQLFLLVSRSFNRPFALFFTKFCSISFSGCEGRNWPKNPSKEEGHCRFPKLLRLWHVFEWDHVVLALIVLVYSCWWSSASSSSSSSFLFSLSLPPGGGGSGGHLHIYVVYCMWGKDPRTTRSYRFLIRETSSSKWRYYEVLRYKRILSCFV